MKNILITGGAGYIGSHTVQCLKKNGYQCIVLDNLVYGHKEAILGDKFENVCLSKYREVFDIFERHKIDAVMHFAAYTYVGESVQDPQKYYKNNVIGTLNLLEAMLAHGVKNFVFSSTCATYGEPQYTPIDENHTQRPINSYGRAKFMIEQILEDYASAYGMRYIALRYFNAAGASKDGSIGESHNPETHLIPLVLQTIKGSRPVIKIFGTDYNTPDGTCIRDYIHVCDLADAHVSALNTLDKFCGCLNLGTGRGYSVREIITAAEKVTNGKCNTEEVGRRSGDPAILYAANEKAKNILNWSPKFTNIEDILTTAWNWETNRKF